MYRHWINKEGKINTGTYYWFKTWKVYRSFKWHEAEQIDKNGVLKGDDKTRSIIIYTNYADKYK